jgi:hypothetical protein
MKDLNTPNIDRDGDGAVGGVKDTTAFQNGEDYVRLAKKFVDATRPVAGLGQIHGVQNQYFGDKIFSPYFVYFEADFSSAAAQSVYKTVITIESFTE